jgi:hypothetical protein
MSALACQLPKAAGPVSASTCHSVACLNVREGSRPAVRGKRPGYRCFGRKAAVRRPKRSQRRIAFDFKRLTQHHSPAYSEV